MATPGELTNAVARVFALPENAVAYPYRVLREHGEVTKAGRGRSAAKVTSRDAANLVIAVAGSLPVKDIYQAWSGFAALPPASGEISNRTDRASHSININPPPTWTLEYIPIDSLRDLPETHTFAEALAALIHSAEVGELQSAIDHAVEQVQKIRGEPRIPVMINIYVRLFGPYPQAVMRLGVGGFHEEKHYCQEIPIEQKVLAKWETEHQANHGDGDLNQTREFSARTIIALGDLIRN